MKKIDNKLIKIIIFDMDGTLYQHDGVNNTFKNSTLFYTVMDNSLKFVIDREKCAKDFASKLVNEAYTTDTIGISNFMAKRYGITRSDFFDIVWDIEPSTIVKNFEKQVQILIKLAKSGKRLFLLTGAPRAWMRNVTNFLKINDIFERQYCGEMFTLKDEVFKALSSEFEPKELLSIGDQMESDILPAAKVGINTKLIKKPEDLEFLL